MAFVFSAYFDESGDDDLLCVAGYFFVKSKLREFEKRCGHVVASTFRIFGCPRATRAGRHSTS